MGEAGSPLPSNQSRGGMVCGDEDSDDGRGEKGGGTVDELHPLIPTNAVALFALFFPAAEPAAARAWQGRRCARVGAADPALSVSPVRLPTPANSER
jgi:hypothetical protein